MLAGCDDGLQRRYKALRPISYFNSASVPQARKRENGAKGARNNKIYLSSSSSMPIMTMYI